MSKPSMRRYLESYDDYLASEYDDMPDRPSQPDPDGWLAKWMRKNGWDFSAPKTRRAA